MPKLTLLQVFLFWVAGFGTASFAARRKVAALAERLPAPRMIKYFVVATPVILLEEAFTIETPYFWGILLMLIAFYIMFFPLYLVQRYSRCSFLLASMLFGSWGCFNEFVLVGRMRELDGPVLLVMCLLCFLIYAVMAVLPSCYLQASLKRSPAGRAQNDAQQQPP